MCKLNHHFIMFKFMLWSTACNLYDIVNVLIDLCLLPLYVINHDRNMPLIPFPHTLTLPRKI